MQSVILKAILALLALPNLLLSSNVNAKYLSFESQTIDEGPVYDAGIASDASELTLSGSLSSNNTYDLAKRQSTWQYYNDVSQLRLRYLPQEARSC